MDIALLYLLIPLVIPAALYVAFARGGQRAWGLVPVGLAHAGAGAYRGAPLARWEPGRAPVVVRVAAFTCFLVGQFIVPGALAALMGLLAFCSMASSGRIDPVLTIDFLSAPTGLIVAARMLGAGASMLGRAPAGVARARAAAHWAICHNVVLLLAIAFCAALGGVEPDLQPIAAGICAVTVAAIGQALLVRRAAAALDAYGARQAEEVFA